MNQVTWYLADDMTTGGGYKAKSRDFVPVYWKTMSCGHVGCLIDGKWICQTCFSCEIAEVIE